MKSAKNKASLSKRNKLLILFGFLFFINPLLRGFDILPDVFGCILIYFGLTQLAFFDGAVDNARKCFIYLAVVEAVHCLTMTSVLTAENSSNRMLAVTVLAIIDAILYVIIFRQLFSGINYYSMRNNCNKALQKCDGTAFLTYLAFFIRLAATLIPELLATIEIYLYAEDNVDISLEELDKIADIMTAKPLIEILFIFIAAVVGIAWYISLFGLIKAFFSEAGDKLDSEYTARYTSNPQKTRATRLKISVYTLYFALFFAIDFVMSGMRIVPASVMFLVLFIASFLFKGISDFKGTKIYSSIAFVLLLGAEIFRHLFLPTENSFAVYQIELKFTAIGAVIALVTMTACLLAVRAFLKDLRTLSIDLSGKSVPTSIPWAVYCITAVLWTAGYAVPYLYSYVATLRLFASCIFIWQTVKVVTYIHETEQERVSLYGE